MDHLTTTNCQLPSTANCHHPPTDNHQPPPTATNCQPPSTANRQPGQMGPKNVKKGGFKSGPRPLGMVKQSNVPANNRQPPSTANQQPPTATNCQPPSTANQQPPTATNCQPPATANRQPAQMGPKTVKSGNFQKWPPTLKDGQTELLGPFRACFDPFSATWAHFSPVSPES